MFIGIILKQTYGGQYMYKSGNKNIWSLILFLLAGVVIGGFIGEYLGNIPNLNWLKYGKEFGLTSPLILDLGVIKLQFGLMLRFTISGIIGLILSVIAYKRI